MKKYEIYTERFEFNSGKSWPTLDGSDVWDLYNMESYGGFYPVEGFDDLSDALECWNEKYANYGWTRESRGIAGWLLNGEVAFLMEFDVDEFGNYECGEYLKYSAAGYKNKYE